MLLTDVKHMLDLNGSMVLPFRSCGRLNKVLFGVFIFGKLEFCGKYVRAARRLRAIKMH